MLINPSLNNFLENIIFDFQITIDKVHFVQISSPSDNCITTDIMQKTPRMVKKLKSLKYRGLVPTIQVEPDFSRTCSFCVVVDKVELITYIKFQRILITGWTDMGKLHKKYPQKGFFPI